MTEARFPAIEIVADRDCASAFLPALASALERAGYVCGVTLAASLQPGRGPLLALLSLERAVLRHHRPCWCDRLDAAQVASLPAAPDLPDFVIDLTRDGVLRGSATILRPTFNGATGEDGLALALLAGGTPRIRLLCRKGTGEPRPVASGTASLEAAAGIGGAMEAVWSRVVVLILRALSSPDAPAVADEADAEPLQAPARTLSSGSAAMRGAKLLARAAAHAAYRLCCEAPHWRIGWRFVEEGQDVFSRRDLGGARWNVLPDPGGRFYADPFPWYYRGRDFIFFEELPHATGKGIISVSRFDADGRPGPAEPVVEEPWHLSYPFLIEEGAALWMIPESSLGGEIAIWRCVDFPLRWEKHAVLVSGVEAADASAIRHDGRWYMFAVVRDGVGGYSDTLAIWHADALTGPWQPHSCNPLLVDDRGARPAGWFVRRGDELWRPVQDCRDGYGAALGLARIDRLDPEGFSQTVETVLRPGARWPGRKLHTLNRRGRLEVIDGSVIRPRTAPARWLAERLTRP